MKKLLYVTLFSVLSISAQASNALHINIPELNFKMSFGAGGFSKSMYVGLCVHEIHEELFRQQKRVWSVNQFKVDDFSAAGSAEGLINYCIDQAEKVSGVSKG